MWKRILLLWCPLGALAAVNESISWGTLVPSRHPRRVTQVTLTTDCRGVNFTTTSDDDTITFDGVATTNWTIEFPSCVWFPDGRVARGADVSAVDARGSLKFGYLYAIRNNLTVDYVEHLPSHASTIILDNLGINALHDDLSTDDRGRPVIANRVQMVNNTVTTISGVRFPDTIDVLELSNNKIAHLGDLSRSRHITFLLVGFNRLQSLVDAIFPSSLLHFFPMYNNITSLLNVRFPSALQTLDLQGNQLTSLANVSWPTNLLDLSVGLSFNAITSLDNVVFPSTLDQLQLAHNRITEVRANFPSSLTSLCLAGNNITAFYANRSQFELLARLRNPNKSSLTYDRHRGASGKWNFQGPCDIVLSTTATNTTCVDHTHTRLLFDVFPICMLPDDEASTGSSSAPSEGYLHVVGVAAGGMLLLLTLLVTTTFYRHRATKWQSSTSHETHLPLETPLAIRNDVRFDPALRSRRVPASDVERHAVLARGGCGIVYRASIHGSRMVAMKRILPTRADDINVVEDFMAEIRLSASLEHPNIVAFVGMTWTSVYNLSAIYELMSHGDLWQFLRRSHGLTWHGPGVSKASILRDVVAALVYLHALSPMVVHRDLKAKNVLLNDAYVAKLGDFGASRECADHTMTAEIGTVPWIAPEVLKGTRYSEKADIYSFGVLVSEVDTVKVPYSNVHDCCPSADGTSVALASANIAMRVVKGTLQPSFSPSCPSVVLDIARQCLSYDPDDRPSAAQLAAWLQRLSL